MYIINTRRPINKKCDVRNESVQTNGRSNRVADSSEINYTRVYMYIYMYSKYIYRYIQSWERYFKKVTR